MNNTILLTLKRMIDDLNEWCSNYHSTEYIDPTISLRIIADRASSSLEQIEQKKEKQKIKIKNFKDKLPNRFYKIK